MKLYVFEVENWECGAFDRLTGDHDIHFITVSNVPDYGKTTVAEHVFALLLTISHRMEEAVQRILETTVDNLVAYAQGQPRNVGA